MHMKNSRLWKLFLTFFKIGAFTFGGGYAMIPLIQKEAVQTHGWITDDDILEIIAIAESTPGPILTISYVLREFAQVAAVQYAFNGIRAGVLALLFKALFTMYKKAPKGWVSYVVMAGAFVATAFLNIPVLAVIIGCAVFGLVTALLAERGQKQ